MEFRYPIAAAETNANYLEYLTKNLKDSKEGRAAFEELIAQLGNAVDIYPDWHPILTAPPNMSGRRAASIAELDTYQGIDHTVCFVRGFVTCPYSEEAAKKQMNTLNGALILLSSGWEGFILSMEKGNPIVADTLKLFIQATTEVLNLFTGRTETDQAFFHKLRTSTRILQTISL